MRNQIRKMAWLWLTVLTGLLFVTGCQKSDPTINAAPPAAPDAKAPARVQRNWKKIGPIGKGGGDI